MTPDAVLEILQRGTWVAIECTAPLLGIGITVGLIMGLLQAATQISEPALTFVPKMAALGVSLFLFGSWVIERLVTLGRDMFLAIGELGGP